MLRLKTLVNFDYIFFVFAAYLIARGLLRREDSFLTAETGTGYVLGIIGASMMLLLLLYPVRKHARVMRGFGPIKFWFRIHMLLGVAGPVLILYHSNFSLGSTNSNIALICMLIVAGSGLFGRLFYSRIHDGLYGRKIELAELQSSLQKLKDEIDNLPEIDSELERFQQYALGYRSFLSVLMAMPYVYGNAFLTNRRLRKDLKNKVNNLDARLVKKFQSGLDAYFSQVKRVYGFSIYERLFSLWHVLHIPLFIMMVISGVVHVIAVHLY